MNGSVTVAAQTECSPRSRGGSDTYDNDEEVDHVNTQTRDLPVTTATSNTSIVLAPISGEVNGKAVSAFAHATSPVEAMAVMYVRTGAFVIANAKTNAATTKAPSRPPRAVPM